eukprot:516324-Rhodomonas_salina.1
MLAPVTSVTKGPERGEGIGSGETDLLRLSDRGLGPYPSFSWGASCKSREYDLDMLSERGARNAQEVAAVGEMVTPANKAENSNEPPHPKM